MTSLLGKKEGRLPTLDPERRKEKMVKELLMEGVANNDWMLIDFVLRKCWNKERVFLITCEQCGSLLHVATKNNFPRVVRVLIEHGINVNNRNQDGDTSLHIAARSGFSDILDLLFESGCNPFIDNRVGKQAIDDCVEENKAIKEKLRLYSVRCSRVNLMKNIETWKNIVSEEERKDELIKSRIRNQADRKTSVVVTPPNLKRSDSGIISDLDSDNKSLSSQISISSTSSTITKTAHKSTDKSFSLKVPNEKGEKNNSSGTRVSKSLSFNVKDIANQYNNVTAALRKLSTHGKNDVKPTEVVAKEQQNKNHKKDHLNNKTEKNNHHKAPGGGLRFSSLYGEPKMSKRKKRIDRTHRMSLPMMLPMFAPPESYI